MRKIFLAVAAMAMLATACTKDDSALVGNESLVSFSVSSPELATRVEDGKGLSTNHLQYAFYDENGEILTALTDEVTNFVGSTTINVPLVEGRIYSAIFWADNTAAPYQVDLAGKIMTITDDEFDGNADKYDAFYKYEVNIDPKKKVHKIELTRPFAQINIATADKAAAANAGFNAVATQVTVRAHSTLNLATGVVGDNDYVDYTYTWATLPTSPATATVGSKSYDMLAMNYVLVNERELVNVTMEASEEEVSETATYADAITRNYTTVPVQRNYRTYIVGNLLTTPNDFNVETKPGFNDTTLPDTDLEQFIMDIQTVGGEFTLTSDITLKEALVVRKDVVLDLAGHTITGPAEARDAANNKIHVIVNEGTLTIKGGVISSVAENGGSAIMNKGTLTVENATLNGAPNAGSSWPSYAVNNTGKMTVTNTTITSYHGAVASYDEGVVTLNNSTIDMAGIPGFTNHGIYTYNGGKVVVNGGTYANKATDQNATGASVINGNVEVNAGTFSGRIENYYGTPVLKGGSYSVKPNAKFVATGYKVIVKDGKYVVVANDVNNVVESKAELKSALEAAKTNNETNVVIDAAGANIGDLNYGLTKALVPAGSTVTIRNANVQGKSYGNAVDGTVIFEDCTFYYSGPYSIHFDAGNGDVIFKNCDLNGWNSFGASLNSVEFEGCTLTGNGSYALIRSYVDLTLTDCVINTSNANHNDAYPEGVEVIDPATLTENNVTYIVSNPKELKAAIIKGGKIEFAKDITVDEWTMFSEDLNISNGEIITIENINVTIDGKGHTLTVNAIESAGNNDQLFQGASVLNISDLTIKYADGLTTGGFSLHSGVIKNVHFIGGGASASSAAIFPKQGEIKVEDCIFDTNGVAFYFDDECDNLTVTGCTFNQKDTKNVILLRGDVKFTDNIINSGRTVNVVSGSPVVTGNDFNDVRFKVYGAATATISNNTINNLEFDGTTYASTFTNNTLSAAAEAVLNGATKVN